MSNYKFFNHTADIGIEITGRTAKTLFVNAAYALFDVMIEHKTGRAAKGEKKIIVEGTDISDLMMNFLRELLYLFNGEQFVMESCEMIQFTHKTLQARLAGESLQSNRHVVKTEIKAVTYSGLKVEKTQTGWSVRVIFDV